MDVDHVSDDEDPSARHTRGNETGQTPEAPGGFPVVGIGASAGGLDAVSTLLGELPADPGLAIVVVMHGDPDEKSQLASLLDRATDMEVVEIQEGTEIQSDRIHVCPPGLVPEVHDGHLKPLSVEREGVSHAIDRFFRSLSEAYRARAIGVIMSGNLADGVQGLQTIQQRGGIAIVQDPETAQHRSMPERAVAAGHIDQVLAPAEIAEELLRIRKQWASAPAEDQISEDTLQKVFHRVHELTGVDLSHYKRSTLARRIDRRMIATDTGDLDAYLEVLMEDPEEARALHDESLIHVTSFFRDPEVFEALRDEFLPELVDRLAEEERPLRIWVPGCSTGEEAYSIGILVSEYIEETGADCRIQVFGTDISDQAIDTAREGRYPLSIADQVSDERLQRFFTKEEGAYRVREPLRNACVFARQDLLEDPPLSRIDLLSCRNVLIYLHHDHQEDVATTLHYALDPDGVLLLGSSESFQRFRDPFEPVDTEHSIYRPKDSFEGRYVEGLGMPNSASLRLSRERPTDGESPEVDLQREIDRVALEIYAPPAIVLDEELEVVQFRNDVSDYLDPQAGQASFDLMRIAPRGLAMAIRAAIEELEEQAGPVRKQGVSFSRGGQREEASLRVFRIQPSGGEAVFYLAAFEQDEEVEHHRPLLGRVGDALVDVLEPSKPTSSQRVRELEEELDATQAYLQSVIEDYEATNEELRSTHEEALSMNEELQSTNEELQSTNEELETAKEELQSTNEELTTVNQELRERNEEIEQINDDLVNLLRGVGLPIVMLTADLRIRRFTPQAGDLLGLIDADVTRPLDDLRLPFDDEDLKPDILKVLDTLSVQRSTITDKDGDRYRLRITPYRTQEDKIDGAVLVFWDLENSEDVL